MTLSLQLPCTLAMNVVYNYGQHRAVQQYHRKNSCYIHSLGVGEVFHVTFNFTHVKVKKPVRRQASAPIFHSCINFSICCQCQDILSRFLSLFNLFSLTKNSFLQSAWLSNNTVCDKWIVFLVLFTLIGNIAW